MGLVENSLPTYTIRTNCEFPRTNKTHTKLRCINYQAMTRFLAWLGFLFLWIVAGIAHQTEETCQLDGTCMDVSGESTGRCEDLVEECELWAKQDNLCETNREFMLSKCPKSCNACEKQVQETAEDLPVEDDAVEDDGNEDEYGKIQSNDVTYSSEIEQALLDMKKYFRDIRENKSTTAKMLELLGHCKNQHQSCAFWKVLGECEKVRREVYDYVAIHGSKRTEFVSLFLLPKQ